MIIFNTTFHVHLSVKDEFIAWVRKEYFPAALKNEAITEPTFAKLLIEVQEDAVSYAVQLKATSLEAAVAWHDNEGEQLRSGLMKRFGERVVFFTTYMESVNL